MTPIQESSVPSEETSKMVLCPQRYLRNDVHDTTRNMEVDPINQENIQRRNDQVAKPFICQTEGGAQRLQSESVCQALELDGEVEVVCQSFSRMKRVTNNGTKMVEI